MNSVLASLIAIVVIAAVTAAYFTPALIGGRRHVANQRSVIVVNFFLGWTMVGWVIALAMALRDNTLPAAGGAGSYAAHDIGRRASR